MNQTVSPKKSRILVAPLDWGLGHATRCIPLITALLKKNCEVILAGEGKTATLLQTEFPQLLFLPLTGYNVQYAKKRVASTGKLFLQIPKILAAIRQEQAWLQKIVTAYKIDAVISDNRYGLHHKTIPSVFITHQLLIKTGFGSLADRALQKLNYRYLNRFTECWVPDSNEGFHLAGDLSYPAVLPLIPTRYIGILSRYKPPDSTPLTHYLLIILSGPEPQRTVLEKLLLQQVKNIQQPVFFVRGLPGTITLPPVPYHVTITNHLATTTLQKAMEGATFVISRCGYSTVMDIATLQKKSILIPTPGQTEQEYLAKHLTKNNMALCIPQSKLGLKNALELAATFPYEFRSVFNNDNLSVAIDSLLKKLEF
jgi:uncharacterized protein (TIGR00661 family)